MVVINGLIIKSQVWLKGPAKITTEGKSAGFLMHLRLFQAGCPTAHTHRAPRVPQHQYCHFPIITIWHRGWLCAGKVCPSAFCPRKPNRFGSLHLTDNSDNSSLLGNS